MIFHLLRSPDAWKLLTPTAAPGKPRVDLSIPNLFWTPNLGIPGFHSDGRPGSSHAGRTLIGPLPRAPSGSQVRLPWIPSLHFTCPRRNFQHSLDRQRCCSSPGFWGGWRPPDCILKSNYLGDQVEPFPGKWPLACQRLSVRAWGFSDCHFCMLPAHCVWTHLRKVCSNLMPFSRTFTLLKPVSVS